MNVYLIPDADSTYVSCISDDAPSTEAIFLVEEGCYPVEILYKRHDLNMDAMLYTEIIENRDALIEFLDFQGQCRNEIVRMWNFYTYDNSLVEIHRLFDRCYDRKAELMIEEMLEACEDLEDNICEIVGSIDENITF